MQPEDKPRYPALRIVLVVDATLLLALGVLLMAIPKQVEVAFHFTGLPEGVSYLVGLWGCLFISVAVGCGIAATDPVRHVAWVQSSIVRGALECAFGLVCVSRGMVLWSQAGVGIVVAAIVTIAYLLLYPRGNY
jgi:hypothetical protein